MIISDDGCAELDALLLGAVERCDIPGLVAVVANRDHIIFRGAFGTLDSHGAIAMPLDAIFNIASMTKPVTSVAILMLQEQGLLDIDNPIGRYLPDLIGREVVAAVNESDGSYTTRPATRDVTIRDLLTHTSGFGYDFSNETLYALCRVEGRNPRDLPLLHDPGSQWTYGMGTAVLGEAIERITNIPLDQYFESHIFQPLGMQDTGFDLKPEKRSRLVSLFSRTNGAFVGEPASTSHEPSIRGDYGLLSTADDYIRFLQMLLNRGNFDKVQLLTEQSVQALTTNQIGSLKVQKQPGVMPAVSNAFPLGAGSDTFSLGFQLKEGVEENGRSHGSYSWAGLFNTHFWADPQQGIAAVLLMQVLPCYDDLCIRLLTDFEHHIYRNLRLSVKIR
jgi:CubicO group peptidase (beta-lactamase class C family)